MSLCIQYWASTFTVHVFEVNKTSGVVLNTVSVRCFCRKPYNNCIDTVILADPLHPQSNSRICDITFLELVRLAVEEMFDRVVLSKFRLVNIELSSIVDTLSPILFKYRWSYRRYFWEQLSIRYRRYFWALNIPIPIPILIHFHSRWVRLLEAKALNNACISLA